MSLLRSQDFITFSMHLLDILLPLKQLSASLQGTKSVVSQNYIVMQNTLQELQEYRENG